MTDASEWQGRVGQSWAEEWRRTDRSFSQLTERLLQEQRGLGFTNVLDIGCGAGEISLAIARGHPEAHITGIDISGDLIAQARSRAEHSTNTEFLVADASIWRPESGRRPEFLVSRHGVMFFDEPLAAFSNLHSAAAPNGRLAFSCFQSAAVNFWVKALGSVLGYQQEQPADYAPGPFAFGERSRVELILEQSGFSDIEFVSFEYAMIFGAGDNAVNEALTFFSRIGPVAGFLREVDAAERERILAKLRELAEVHLVDDIVAMPAASWIVTAQA